MTSLLDDPDVATAREWANFYRTNGFNPLPMRRDRKAPAMRSYTRERDEGFPLDLIPRWWTPNCQVCLGVRWGLCVVDLDGAAAIGEWSRWTAWHGEAPPTWEVRHSDGGLHLWFSLPIGTDELPSRVLWKSEGVEHTAIELLGDGRLVVAPPSRHPTTGRCYRFLPGHGPRDMPRPAVIPDWVLGLPAARPARLPGSPSSLGRREIPLLPLRRPDAGRWERDAVLDALGDPRPLVSSWGLRLVSGRDWNPRGWVECHAVGREDRNPSAGLSRDGGYWEPGMARPVGLFDLSVLLGVYPSWRDCVNDLGRRLGVPPIKELQRVG